MWALGFGGHAEDWYEDFQEREKNAGPGDREHELVHNCCFIL